MDRDWEKLRNGSSKESWRGDQSLTFAPKPKLAEECFTVGGAPIKLKDGKG